MSTAGRTCRMRQEEGGHVASQRARDPRRRLCQLLQGMPAGGRLDSELLALRETVWRARGVQPGHEHVFGGCDGDEQRREVGVQGATGGQRGRCAAGHVFGFVPRLYCGRRRALVHAVRRRGGCAARFVSSSRLLRPDDRRKRTGRSRVHTAAQAAWRYRGVRGAFSRAHRDRSAGARGQRVSGQRAR